MITETIVEIMNKAYSGKEIDKSEWTSFCRDFHNLEVSFARKIIEAFQSRRPDLLPIVPNTLDDYKPPITRLCLFCGKDISDKSGINKYCSKVCGAKYRKQRNFECLAK